jgi:uncharacterized membrane protein
MLILVIIAVVSLLLGLLFLGDENALKKLSDTMNKVVIKQKEVSKKYTKVLGVFLILFAGLLFLVALKFK